MWQFIVAFIVVFCAGLVIREIIKRKNAPPPEPTVTPALPEDTSSTAPAAFCRNCGAKLENDASYCSHCGAKVNSH